MFETVLRETVVGPFLISEDQFLPRCLSLGRLGVTIPGKCLSFWVRNIGVQETVLLVNHALARGTPAIFVIFVVSRGSSSKALVLLVRMQIRHFRHFRQNPPFSGGTKARF